MQLVSKESTPSKIFNLQMRRREIKCWQVECWINQSEPLRGHCSCWIAAIRETSLRFRLNIKERGRHRFRPINPRSGSSHHHLLLVAFNISARFSLMSSTLAPPTARPRRQDFSCGQWARGVSTSDTGPSRLQQKHKAFHFCWCQNPKAASQQHRAGLSGAGRRPETFGLVLKWNDKNTASSHFTAPHHRQESDHFQRRSRAPVKLDIQSRGSVSVGFPMNNNNVFWGLWACFIRTTSYYITQCSPTALRL